MADLIDKLRGIEISVVRANRALLGTTTVTSANELVRAAADRLEAQDRSQKLPAPPSPSCGNIWRVEELTPKPLSPHDKSPKIQQKELTHD